MLALFRSFMNTWAARALLLVLVASFGAWGIAGVFNAGPSAETAATVDGRSVTAQELDRAYRGELQQMGGMFGSPERIPQPMRRALAQQTLNRLVVQAAVQAQAGRLGLVVPDAALREAVFAIPAFHGAGGQFDRTVMNERLQQAGLTEARFLSLMRDDIAQRELVGAIKAGVSAPDALAAPILAFVGEKRTAQVVELPFSAAPEPALPDAAVLKRWYDNHPEDYRTPELRRIRAVVLSADTIARGLDIPDDQLQAAYKAREAQFHTAEKRSAEIVTAQSEAQAQQLAAAWRAGADWAAVQADAARLEPGAPSATATAVAVDDLTEAELPSTELGKAVFSAAPDTVAGPVRGSLGWVVLRVTKVTPAVDTSFEQARPELRTALARDQAAGLLDERVQKLQDVLAGGAGLDEIPADLGAAAVEGTTDKQGRTAAGEPAPIPGSTALRDAVVAHAFAESKDAPAQLVEGPDQSYYAVTVQAITPPADKPYDQVAEQVADDWRSATERHEEEERAARLFAAVKGGASLRDAATIEGLQVGDTPAIGRGTPPQGVAPQLASVLFGLKPGEATMVETPDGFVVGVLGKVERPDKASDPLGFEQMREQLSRAVGDDAEITYAAALRDRARPRINAEVVAQVAQQ